MRPLKFVFALAVFVAACSQHQTPTPNDTDSRVEATSSSGIIRQSCTHENLTVFVITNPEARNVRKYITLQEALAEGKARVVETGNVNQLTLSNLTEDRALFIQAGEIVRGGKQDRAIGVDLLLEPHSGEVPIQAFCVEQGRWRARGDEPSHEFQESNRLLNSNAMKIGVLQEQDQGVVWNSVADSQNRLTLNAQVDVADPQSATSLQLSLENEKLQEMIKPYVDAISAHIERHEHAVGLVVAINGRIYSADTYASPLLFTKLQRKLVEAAATEAIAQLDRPRSETNPTPDDVAAFLAAAEDAKVTEQREDGRLRIEFRETKSVCFSETTEPTRGNAWVHRSYMERPDDTPRLERLRRLIEGLEQQDPNDQTATSQPNEPEEHQQRQTQNRQ